MSTSNSPPLKRDYGFAGMVGLIAVVAIWLLLMPVVPGIQIATMKRFQLASGSFLGWAAQQPIPSMYNFRNRIEGHLDQPAIPESPVWHYTNHFPTRVITFGFQRAALLQSKKEIWLTTESSYRGARVATTYHLQPSQGGKAILKRVGTEVTTP